MAELKHGTVTILLPDGVDLPPNAGNLLCDAEAYTMLRKVNDQVKAQSKYEPAVATRFTAVTEYFASTGRPAGDKNK